MERPGYIYICTNREWGSWFWKYYKVGTNRTQFNSWIDTDQPFSMYKHRCLFQQFTTNAYLAWRAVEEALKPYHLYRGGGNEFYRCSISKLESIIIKTMRKVEQGRVWLENDTLRDSSTIMKDKDDSESLL